MQPAGRPQARRRTGRADRLSWIEHAERTKSPRTAWRCRTRAFVPSAAGAPASANTSMDSTHSSRTRPTTTPTPPAAPDTRQTQRRPAPGAQATERTRNRGIAFCEPSLGESGAVREVEGAGRGERVGRGWSSPRPFIACDYQTAPRGTRRRACLDPPTNAQQDRSLPPLGDTRTSDRTTGAARREVGSIHQQMAGRSGGTWYRRQSTGGCCMR